MHRSLVGEARDIDFGNVLVMNSVGRLDKENYCLVVGVGIIFQ